MAEERLALTELLEKAGDGDFLRSVAEAVLQLLMEADVDGLVGAGRYERSGERTTWRNGFRDRLLDTRLGRLQLRIPKLRQGSYFPPFLEPRKMSAMSEKSILSRSRSAVATPATETPRSVMSFSTFFSSSDESGVSSPSECRPSLMSWFRRSSEIAPAM